MMRRLPLTSLLVLALVLCGAALLAGLALMLDLAKPANAGAPNYNVVSIGGLQYESMLGRAVDPADPVDAAIVKGLPASERHLAPGEILFGAFIAVANDSPRSLPAASRIELEDNSGRRHQPLRLPAANPYAYPARPVPPHTSLPGVDSPADENLAATGYLLLFRVSSNVYHSGTFELVVHDPSDPARTASVVI
jgi:hypothetical protein